MQSSLKIDAFIILASSQNPILISLLCVELIDLPFILFFGSQQVKVFFSFFVVKNNTKGIQFQIQVLIPVLSALHRFRFGFGILKGT